MNIRVVNCSFYVLLVGALGCQQSIETRKEADEIWATEIAFEKDAATRGLAKAFYSFASEEAVIKRDKLIFGRDSIREFYSTFDSRVKFSWKPDTVIVSQGRDLGYTYGKYTHSFMDSLGVEQTTSGIFHTIWKKQKDGSWKYVWD